MPFINFKDQWFQELRKVNWLCPGRRGGEVQTIWHYPGAGTGSQSSLFGRWAGESDPAEPGVCM